MAVEKKAKKTSDVSDRAKQVFDSLNLNKKPASKEIMTQYSIKIHVEDRLELDRIFSALGLNSFSNGVRFALAEFKRNHS